MKLLFLSSLIIFCLLIAYENKKHSKMEEKFNKEFWDREERANHVRKKSLENLPYIRIPEELIPSADISGLSAPDAEKYGECQRILTHLSSQKIVNFTGYTNTDLKLEYGTANITVLSEYDQNYTLFARTLQTLAEFYYQNTGLQDAARVLEFAVSTNTDITHSYYLLADIYDALGTPERKQELLLAAESIRTPARQLILRRLQEPGPYSDWLSPS